MRCFCSFRDDNQYFLFPQFLFIQEPPRPVSEYEKLII